MDTILTEQEKQNRRKGITVSTVFQVLLIILALLPLLTFPDPPPGQEGILVNLGLPDVGQGDENAGPAEPTVQEEVVEEQPVEETTPPPPKPVEEPAPSTSKEVVVDDNSEEIALEKKKQAEEAAKRKKEQEDEAKRIAEEQARKKAEEDARKKAEEEARKKEEANKLKDLLSGGLSGSGKGKGNTGKPGNQGDPDGDPDASKLEGISTGSGTVGGGLGSRGVTNAPRITDNSQKQGTVVVKVCVDKKGKVTSAEFTQRGSTTSDGTLKSLAIQNARKWTFSNGQVDKQCGTITYRFQVK